MSTEARRAPFPPRPTDDPAPAETEAQTEEEPSVFAPRRPLERPRETRPPVPEAPITTPPPPPPASARFPDAPPPRTPAVTPTETTARLRVPAGPEPAAQVPPPPAWSPAPVPDPALSWNAPWPVGAFGQPEPYEEPVRGLGPLARLRSRTGVAAVCVVLGLGLIGGALAGSWLTGEDGERTADSGFAAAGSLWHNVPVDQLFPPTVQGTGAGPGGADRSWTRIAVAPDTGCAGAFDPLLARALAPVGCARLLRATYTDATRTHVTTVGLLFTKADPAAMAGLAARFRNERLDRRTDLLPLPYAAKGTPAAGFGAKQRASWTVSVLTDAPIVAFAVSGWADGRTVDTPEPAPDAVRSGATSAPAQAGLGNEAQGLADRIQRKLRQTVSPATEKPS
ncbi:hypothetical protein [Streptomyces griseoluteus]|uniref:hypothetical protein n=1 Tax=Streptomyces griseoluteus TaxID=29306 RepID=UPI0019AE37BC|nr:hypothetical protein [Streptomyces griseoluteus]GHF21280.1 hypothetical protein GCM10017776_44110 [Streptomyces griseoluteus]